MAADGVTAIRYYPVEMDPGSGQFNSGLPIGISRWAYRFNSDEFDPGTITTLYPDGSTFNSRYRNGPWVGSDPIWREYMTVVYISLPTGGAEYAEQEFLPLAEGGAEAPILAGNLPMDLAITFGLSDYAGGVVQVGIYLGGEFQVLASFQHEGFYFPSWAVADGGWDSLPGTEPDIFLIDDGDGSQQRQMIALDAAPVPLFWTALKQSIER